MPRSKLVDAYITRAAPFARPILRHLRRELHAGCPGLEEAIKWNHASFVYRGQIFAMVGAFKAHVTLGFWHQDMEKLVVQAGLRTDGAAGLFGRLTSLADLPDGRTLQRLIRTATSLHDSGKPSRPKRQPRPESPLPPELAEGLRRNSRAAAHWQAFPPSARREYVDWINDAKRTETREQRLLTTMEWVAEGKRRHWKYAEC